MTTNASTHESAPDRRVAPAAVMTPEQMDQELLRMISLEPKPRRPRPAPDTTEYGTPHARSWDGTWVEQVEAAEKRLGRRICGGRMLTGRPCQLEPMHDNGRCRFHGGFALTGAPAGNRNAVVHALYSRRLRTCGAECPMWKQCPCAGSDVDNLSPLDRPTCPYEQSEYDAALAEAMEQTGADASPEGKPRHLAHNVALLQVMLSRAALALRNGPLTVSTLSKSRLNSLTSAYEKETRVSAQLLGFVRIAAEYRRFAGMLPRVGAAAPQGEGAPSAAERPDTAETIAFAKGAETEIAPEAAPSVAEAAGKVVDETVRVGEVAAGGGAEPVCAGTVESADKREPARASASRAEPPIRRADFLLAPPEPELGGRAGKRVLRC